MTNSRTHDKSTNASVREKLSQTYQEVKFENNNLQVQRHTDEPSLILLSEIEFLEQQNKQLKHMEQNVNEIAELFKDIKQLVQEQQQPIDVIAENISTAKDKAEAGHQELVKADIYQRSSCAIL